MKRFILTGLLAGTLIGLTSFTNSANAQVVYQRSFVGTPTYSYYSGPRTYNAPLGYPVRTYYRGSTVYYPPVYAPASDYGYATPYGYSTRSTYYYPPAYSVYPNNYGRQYWGGSYWR